MLSSSGQRLRREEGLRCRTSFPLCALVRVFCVRPYSTAVCGTGCARHAQHFGLQNGILLLNPPGLLVPLAKPLVQASLARARELFLHVRERAWLHRARLLHLLVGRLKSL